MALSAAVCLGTTRFVSAVKNRVATGTGTGTGTGAATGPQVLRTLDFDTFETQPRRRQHVYPMRVS